MAEKLRFVPPVISVVSLGLCDTLAGDLMVARSFSESGKCDFFSPRDNIVTHSYTMVLQKASPFMSLINFW